MFINESRLSRRTLLALAVSTALTVSALSSPAFAQEFPERPIDVVVGFGPGGSNDRFARAMAPFLSEELGVPVIVSNRPGAGTQISASYVLAQPADGYTLYASAFAPYLIDTILSGGAPYSIEDFDVINFQWFDQYLVAANKDAGYDDLPSLLEAIRDNPGRIRAAVTQGGSGLLALQLMLDAAGIPRENLNVVTFNGAEVRTAVAGGQVDFMVEAAEGSAGIREFITPLAIIDDERSESWNVPAINDALEPMGIKIPVLAGSMRGFAVSSQLREEHPERYEVLVQALRRTLAREDVQQQLAAGNMEGVWTGPERSGEILRNNFEILQQYSDVEK